jgi:hypothetical protein
MNKLVEGKGNPHYQCRKFKMGAKLKKSLPEYYKPSQQGRHNELLKLKNMKNL